MSQAHLLHLLRHLPQSNQDAQTLAALAGTDDVPTLALLHGSALLLHTLGMVDFDPASQLIRARSQTAKYALASLAEYIAADLRLIDDWKTRGVENNLLHNGASFLYALERQRQKLQSSPAPSRREQVAQVIIKRRSPATGEPELYFQYDASARRYQLIGGRWSPRDGADLLRTMIREIEEELPGQPLVYGQDYDLRLIMADYTPPALLSPTFGALTEYHFHIYHLVGLRRPLVLHEHDRWIPLPQVLAGHLYADDRSAAGFSSEIYHAIEAHLPGGLAALADSFI
ncbi:MAG: hypothetical protein MUE40_02550 [Anaerolineae bacterium]|nr:hypothetical protein [Anaerolineae bacterium]